MRPAPLDTRLPAEAEKEITDQIPSTTFAPIRFSVQPAKGSYGSKDSRVLHWYLTAMEDVGSFLVVQAGCGWGQPMSHTWVFDTGAMISQISTTAASRLWSVLEPIGVTRIRCETATQTFTTDFQMCTLRCCRVVDPSRNQGTRVVDTQVLVNPKLILHPMVMGRNTICDLGLSANLAINRVSDEEGRKFALLDRDRAEDWDKHFGGLSTPRDKPEAGPTERTPGTPSRFSARVEERVSGKRTRIYRGPRSTTQPNGGLGQRANSHTKGGRYRRRFYAAANGHAPGIYTNDRDARQAYERYPNPVHKMFLSKEMYRR